MKFTEFSVTVNKYFITKLHIHDIIFYTLHSNIIKHACDFLNIFFIQIKRLYKTYGFLNVFLIQTKQCYLSFIFI